MSAGTVPTPSTPLTPPIREVELPPPAQDPADHKNHVKVRPGTIRLRAPDIAKTIQWTNNTGSPVQIWLVGVTDVLVPLHPEDDLSKPISIGVGGTFAVGVVNNPPTPYLRDYQVYCNAAASGFGDGDSSPHIGCC